MKLRLSGLTVLLVLIVIGLACPYVPELKQYSDMIIGICVIFGIAAIILSIVDSIRDSRARKKSTPVSNEPNNQIIEESMQQDSATPNGFASLQIADHETETDSYVNFGLYTPIYKFMDAVQYSDKLKEIRQRQKQMIREKIACTFPHDLTYNGSKQQGAAIINDWIKLMLRAFNGECEAIILKARFDNVIAMEQRIRKIAASINAIGNRMRVQITQSYIDLKIDELHVAYEYEVFKQDEKERLRQIREEEREKAKVEKELKEKVNKLDKDLQHIQNEKALLQARLDAAGEDDDVTSIQFELDKLNIKAQEIEAEKEDIAEREVNARAGYVYIISNIGSFGENVYKIGMTRRLDPQDRVDELGTASVPFKFDVHAFIFSTDAVALETALHHRFDQQRVNLINTRKEFFKVTLDEIENEVKRDYNGAVEFHRTAAAEEYKETLAIRQRNEYGYSATDRIIG